MLIIINKVIIFFLYGTYEGNELVLRLKNQIIEEAKIEKTGSGWGFFVPATSNNREQEEVRDKNMFQSVLFLWLTCIFIVMFSSGCARIPYRKS